MCMCIYICCRKAHFSTLFLYYIIVSMMFIIITFTLKVLCSLGEYVLIAISIHSNNKKYVFFQFSLQSQCLIRIIMLFMKKILINNLEMKKKIRRISPVFSSLDFRQQRVQLQNRRQFNIFQFRFVIFVGDLQRNHQIFVHCENVAVCLQNKRKNALKIRNRPQRSQNS